MDIQFPIFIRAKDSGYFQTFHSVYELQSELEKIDIKNEEYEAWDRSGVPVKLDVQEPVWLRATLLRVDDPQQRSLLECVPEFVRQTGIDGTDRLTNEKVEEIIAEANAALKKRRLERSSLARLIAKIRQRVGD
jgi:hypothetical protein